MKQQTVVMFCTGGIRCEKAGPMMEQAGFQDVLQLDGGILKYFEECGETHYDGDCFVFDQRVAVDPKLQETDATLCFGCQAVLSSKDQESPKYVPPESCPHCYRSPDVAMAERVEKRHAQIQHKVSPLPGSIPYENRRPLNVPLKHDGKSLIQVLSTMHPHVSHEQWLEWFDNEDLLRDDIPLQPETIVRAGERIERVESQMVEPDVAGDIRLVYEDSMLVVVNKPAPLPMHPSGRFNRNTLGYILDLVYSPQRLRLAHRLDANTTGVVVLSRTKNVAKVIQPQFEAGEVKKRYLARVKGCPEETSFQCNAPIVPRSSQSGARVVGTEGQSALTEFDLIHKFDDGTSLLEARPITGRTNQIRIHLAHLGLPIVGDPLYRGNDDLGDRQTLDTHDDPLCLHAHKIQLHHPEDRRLVEFTAPPPEWASSIIPDEAQNG